MTQMNPANTRTEIGRAWTLTLGVLAALFILLGLGWLFVPRVVSVHMRMPLLAGDGLSTQIGDLASFFLAIGISIFIALWTHRAIWVYPAMLLLVFASVGRVIAWLFHGAGLPLDMVVFELIVAAFLISVASKLTADQTKS